MRISWLHPDVVRATRRALAARAARWDQHFTPGFDAGPAPAGIVPAHWPGIAEHVARAERVSEVIRERGLDAALADFRSSEHAVEVATLIAAAVQVEQVSFDLVAALFDRNIDENVAYGGFLELLGSLGDDRRERVLAVYERFCDAFTAARSSQPMWPDRVASVRDGLASLYACCGRDEQAHALFLERHEDDPDSLTVALSASRAFLAAGSLGRAIMWLALGADRARLLGRPDMAERLEAKRGVLRARQS
ncbi:hypothetical protein [Haliangium sp.]|uniref:hypothetical protein n=1 Tax=Haliangium sp. TaxID=2663208 RepID=UPI003D11368E